jgi:hypothetical protein
VRQGRGGREGTGFTCRKAEGLALVARRKSSKASAAEPRCSEVNVEFGEQDSIPPPASSDDGLIALRE